ncbi:MAG: alpha/beta fold hydrolase [Syntrophales bacterium]
MVEAAAEVIPVRMEDGTSSSITVYIPEKCGKDAPVFICMPAMGIAARYYEPLAAPFAEKGWILVTADLRGLGFSSVRVSAATDFGYHEMVMYDWPAIASAVRTRFAGNPVFFLGHSMGGQLSCLFLSACPEAGDGLVLVAAPSVYYRGWNFPQSWGVLAGTAIAKRLAVFLGYFPGKKLGFGQTEAKTMIRDWANQARTGLYRPAKSPLDFESLLAALEKPVLAFSFKGDFLAPRRSVRNLCAKMSRDRITHIHLDAEGLDHFNWVRNSRPVRDHIGQWLDGGKKIKTRLS